jgi:sRNA-binding protein
MSKAFCGVGSIPKGYKKGSMKECVEKGQVRLYGLYKIDPKLLEHDENDKKSKVKYYTKSELFLKLSKINGTITKLQKTVDGSKNKEEVEKAKKELAELKKEKIILSDYFKRTDKGEKIPKTNRKPKKTTKKASKK